ncbi:MAG: hypothetical protein ABI704_00525 [Kofleriaceae bacterium]
MRRSIEAIMFSTVAFACGPSGRSDTFGNGADGSTGSGSSDCSAPENTPATCSDGIDNNCNGVIDCADPSCSGIGMCPVCGMVEHPTGSPVALPDGIIGSTCQTSTTCAPATPNCVESECHASYVSTLHFGGFGSTQLLTAPSNIVSVCVNISHEWSRDVEISLQAPSGQLIRLQKFLGRMGGEIYLGHPADTDGDGTGTEQGADYCWKPTATNPPMLDYVNNNSGVMMTYDGHPELPPGDYASADPWTMLVGATLNGNWQIVVTDLWPIDAGVIHQWSIAFDPSIVQDCSGPIIQ